MKRSHASNAAVYTLLIWLLPAASLAQAVPAPLPPPGSAPPPAAADTVGASRPLQESLSGLAKADYDVGRILFGDADYAGALVKFQNAFDRSGDVRLLWNIAVCEKNLRHYANVLHLVERYRAAWDARMTPSHRAEVNDVLQTVRTLISTVRIVVDQPDASIFVDGTLAGKSPLTEPLSIDLGNRRIRVSKPGFQDQELVQDFTGGSEVTFNLNLQREVREGRLTILTDASNTISIDGSGVGAGQWQGSLLAGEHRLRVSAPNKRPYARELVIQAGQTRTLHISLEAEQSGSSAWWWVGAGVVAAGGLATGAYFLTKPSAQTKPEIGSWDPGVIPLTTK
jgi:hypothetical protein